VNNLPEVIFRRCRHVISENERVLQAAAALEQSI
jgi:galactokinase